MYSYQILFAFNIFSNMHHASNKNENKKNVNLPNFIAIIFIF